MPFDLHIILADNSREVQVIQQVAKAEHITPEQAASRLLMEGAKLHGDKTPGREMLGAFSSPEDTAILDKAMESIRAHRDDFDTMRDFGF
ncbi:MAG TPA: hypothetical protein VGL56_12320 [Fimbriimonadaceae bacterium]|jgi:hypothetical protein